MRANRVTRRRDGTINRWLADTLEKKVPANPIPVKGVSSADVTIDAEAGIWARVFSLTEEIEETSLPTATDGNQRLFKTMPIILYYHGGGFAVLCPNFYLYDIFCRRLARKCNAIVISVHYR